MYHPCVEGQSCRFAKGTTAVVAPKGATHFVASSAIVFMRITDNIAEVLAGYTSEGDWQSWYANPISAEELSSAKQRLSGVERFGQVVFPFHRKDCGQYQSAF